MAAFRSFWNSPMGPKTTHFWGPVANWGFVISGLADTQKPPELISGNMTSVMCIYSVLCMRFAWMIRPRNYLLLVCHASNESVQLFQLCRWAKAHGARSFLLDPCPKMVGISGFDEVEENKCTRRGKLCTERGHISNQSFACSRYRVGVLRMSSILKDKRGA